MDYANLARTAKRLLGKNGTKCILINPGTKAYNKETNKYENEKTPHNGFCVISNYKDYNVDGTIIKIGDRQVMAVLDGEPIPEISQFEVYDKTGKVLKETYHVINSAPVNPDASTIILYKLQCRK